MDRTWLKKYVCTVLIFHTTLFYVRLTTCSDTHEYEKKQSVYMQVIASFFSTNNWKSIALITDEDYKAIYRQLSSDFTMGTIFQTAEVHHNLSFITNGSSSFVYDVLPNGSSVVYAVLPNGSSVDYDVLPNGSSIVYDGLQGKIVVWCKIQCQEDIIAWVNVKGLFMKRYTWLFVQDYPFDTERFIKIQSLPSSLRPDSNVYVMSPESSMQEFGFKVFRLRHDGPEQVQYILKALYRQKQWQSVINTDSPLLLRGFTLRIGMANFPPIGIINRAGNVTTYNGTAVSFAEFLAKYLGFRCEYVAEKTDSHGAFKNGSWTGLMGMLQRDEIDLTTIRISLTPQRQPAADFTSFVFTTSSVFLMRKPTQSSKTYDVITYTKPFTSSLWMSSLSLIILAFISFVLTFRLGQAFSHFTLVSSLCETLWFTICFTIQVGVNNLPKNSSSYVVMIIFFIFMLMINKSYNSFLTATLTVKKSYNLYDTIDELLDDRSCGISTLGSSSQTEALKAAQSGTLARIWKRVNENPTSLVSSNEEGFKKIKEKKFAYLISYSLAKSFIRASCNFTYIKKGILHRTLHLALQKNSPFHEAISSKIMAIRSAGFFTERESNEFELTSINDCPEEDAVSYVGLHQAFTCFLVLGFGHVMAFCTLCVEYCHAKRKETSR